MTALLVHVYEVLRAARFVPYRLVQIVAALGDLRPCLWMKIVHLAFDLMRTEKLMAFAVIVVAFALKLQPALLHHAALRIEVVTVFADLARAEHTRAGLFVMIILDV